MKTSIIKYVKAASPNRLRTIYQSLRGFFKAKIGSDNKITKGRSSKLKLDILGSHNSITIDASATVTCLIYIRGNYNRIHIGKNVQIKAGELWMEDNNGEILIGDATTIENAHIAVTEPNRRIHIGKDCMLSNGIEIRTGDSHSILNEYGSRINYAKDVIIKDHVWVGSNVSILKGVIVSENSIIATRSVVTNHIDADCIAAGIPAKIIKKNINWKRERVYD